MTTPDGYLRRVRARPYGPREVLAGGVTAWFHGPFAVLTFTGESALTVRVDLDDGGIGADLIELFAAAEAERGACLPRPELLAGEQALAGRSPTVVRSVAVRPGPEGARLTVDTGGRRIEVPLSTSDAARIRWEIYRWSHRG
ncbi:hypothetical protein [Actinomadura rupiterrae]|uniref:hypothetical protein n=1 Tax=Actinomadura rupiterrae TaxID=559627 RepID=UPI0020A4BD9E|nr:hypothetical protein [Actinomadura rupiterrae]MCP2337967.1 hypothetical protein [Actinomadura rupiterrae]